MRTLIAIIALLSSFASVAHAEWLQVTPDHANGLYNVGETPRLTFRVFGQPTNPAYSLQLSITPPGESAIALPIVESHSAYVGAPIAAGEVLYQVSLRLVGPETDVVLSSSDVPLIGR